MVHGFGCIINSSYVYSEISLDMESGGRIQYLWEGLKWFSHENEDHNDMGARSFDFEKAFDPTQRSFNTEG